MAAEAEVEVGRGIRCRIEGVFQSRLASTRERFNIRRASYGGECRGGIPSRGRRRVTWEVAGRWSGGHVRTRAAQAQRRSRDGDVLGICIEVVAGIAIVVVVVASCRVVGSSNGSDGQRGRG